MATYPKKMTLSPLNRAERESLYQTLMNDLNHYGSLSLREREFVLRLVINKFREEKTKELKKHEI